MGPHTVCDRLEQLWINARTAEPGRTRFVEHIRTITAYLVFPNGTTPMQTIAKRGMIEPPPGYKTISARRHHVENLFSLLKDCSRIALRRDKARRSWMGFAHFAATVINLRIAEFSHRP